MAVQEVLCALQPVMVVLVVVEVVVTPVAAAVVVMVVEVLRGTILPMAEEVDHTMVEQINQIRRLLMLLEMDR